MLDTLDRIDWSSVAQPKSGHFGEVPSALRALAAVGAQEEATRAYNRMLCAIGNNHAGTYYPVAVSVIPFFGEILKDGPRLARETVLDILIDLANCFEPEVGFELVESNQGAPMALIQAVRAAIEALSPEVQRLASGSESERERELAMELLSDLRDE